MEASAPLLQVSGLSHAYGSVTALAEVSLSVRDGELVALVGRNGAGKSTLLRGIAAWSAASRGEVRILGRSVRGNERLVRAHALLVPDTPPFWDDLTVWEHLRFVAVAHHLPAGWEDRAGELLTLLGIDGRREAFPGALSRGMRHKLALVMALMLQPRLLLLDEPFGPLDAVSATRLWEVLQLFCVTGHSVLVSCHQWPAEAEPDRCIVMENGQVLADAPTGELAQRYGLAPVTPEGLLHAVLSRTEERSDGSDG